MSAVAGGTIHEPTYYEVLGVSENASTEEIRKAWRALIRDVHPDREIDPQAAEEANRRAAVLNEAYTTLTDSGQRRKYDNRLRVMRGQQPTESPAEEDETAYSDAGSGEEDEEAMWERIQREAEQEAEEAWARWENPPARDRFAEALSELRYWDVSSRFSLAGAAEDLLHARWDFDAARRGESMMLTLPVITAIMAALTVGQALFLAAEVLYSGPQLLAVVGLALGADLGLTMVGARPVKFLMTKAGSTGALSEGEKLLASAALAMRSLWLGVSGFFVSITAVLLLRWIYHLFAEPSLAESVLGYGLTIFPIAWTAVFIAVWLARSLSKDSEQEDNTETEGE